MPYWSTSRSRISRGPGSRKSPDVVNPHFSPPLVARTQSVARMQSARSEADEGVVEPTSRRPNERNEADGPQSASAAERVGEMRAKEPLRKASTLREKGSYRPSSALRCTFSPSG